MAGVYIDSEERGLPFFFFYWNPRAAPGRIPATELITAMDKLVFVDRERGNFVGEGWL